jgi:fido (protein-threonine AMPylation protein)
VMGGPSVLVPGQMFGFLESKKVPAAMTRLTGEVRQAMVEADSDWARLSTLAYLFATFGFNHPFLDGNGHVQRALFAAAAIEMGIPLSNRFAIHPRSYDMLLAHALESYTRFPNRRVEWLSAIAEYLAQWLAGPFDAPGSGLAPL